MNTANSDSVIGKENSYPDNVFPIKTSFAIPFEYEEKFKLVFENAPLGIALVDPFWKIIDANQKLCEILKYSLLEITGKDVREITFSKDLGATFQLMNKMQKGEIDSYKIKKKICETDR